MDVKKLRNELIKQKTNHEIGDLYHYLQVTFAFNSNKMEGSIIPEEITKAIYINNIDLKDYPLYDIIETKNHFKLFDYMLKICNSSLNITIIKKMHQILKNNTTESKTTKIGEFKTLPNVIGSISCIKTSLPKDVKNNLIKLLKKYNQKEEKSIKDIITFHVEFERIHPFSDGNGRIGRMIMFKECLKNGIVPFVILDEDKEFYLRGLKEFNYDDKFLFDTCLNEQDKFNNIFQLFMEENNND